MDQSSRSAGIFQYFPEGAVFVILPFPHLAETGYALKRDYRNYQPARTAFKNSFGVIQNKGAKMKNMVLKQSRPVSGCHGFLRLLKQRKSYRRKMRQS